MVDLKLIFQYALKANASNIILAHNHPSGNRNPSDADIAITKKAESGILFASVGINKPELVPELDKVIENLSDKKS